MDTIQDQLEDAFLELCDDDTDEALSDYQALVDVANLRLAPDALERHGAEDDLDVPYWDVCACRGGHVL